MKYSPNDLSPNENLSNAIHFHDDVNIVIFPRRRLRLSQPLSERASPAKVLPRRRLRLSQPLSERASPVVFVVFRAEILCPKSSAATLPTVTQLLASPPDTPAAAAKPLLRRVDNTSPMCFFPYAG